MTGPACSARSSSDAPVCASLVRATSAKSNPPKHARVADNHQRSCLWTGAPCPQRLYRRPPHPRGLRPHRRLSSMSPVSPGRRSSASTRAGAMERKELLDGRCIVSPGPQSHSAIRKRTRFRISRGTDPPRRGIQEDRPFLPRFLLHEIIFAHSP